jgi:hypothetical protein
VPTKNFYAGSIQKNVLASTVGTIAAQREDEGDDNPNMSNLEDINS